MPGKAKLTKPQERNATQVDFAFTLCKEASSFSSEDPGSKYFRLCEQHVIFAAYFSSLFTSFIAFWVGCGFFCTVF